MQSRPATHPESSGELRRYEALLEMADLMVRHGTLPELFHELTLGLKKVADFHYLNFSIHNPQLKIMQLHWWEGGGDAVADLPEAMPMAESPSGWTWEHQQELLFPNLLEERRFPRALDHLRAKEIRTYYMVPLSTAEKRLGALGVASLKADAYSEQDRRLLRRVAELAALAVENTINREALHDEKQRLQALVDVNRTLASSLEIQRLLPLISECVDRVVPHDFAGVTLYEGDKENMKAYVLSAQPEVIELGRMVSLQQTLSSQAFLEQESKTLTREDLASHSSSIAGRVLGAGIRTIRCVPLLTSKGPLGTLNVGSKKDRAFSQKDEEILNQIAAQLAIALDNARAYREIQALKDRLAEEKLYLEDEIRTELNFEEIIGESLELKRVLAQAKTVAPSGSTVLILGETGTGKELIARAIHRMSKRKDASFIKVNCAAIPMGLLESELFGHEKGAFTGAVSRKIGRMELADKGSLFLDEVGDIPLDLQPKLVRVLQDHEFERLGSNRTVRVDLRLIAATNRDLSQRVAEGSFRSDLFYRLNVFPIHMPPLRKRRSDIPLLVRHFVKKLARRMDKGIETIPSETMEALVNWHWPGNIRELENLMERSVILSEGPVLKTQLPERPSESGGVAGGDTTLANAEREHILRVLRECGGLVSGPKGAALRLGLKRTTLQSKMTKLKISKKDYTS